MSPLPCWMGNIKKIRGYIIGVFYETYGRNWLSRMTDTVLLSEFTDELTRPGINYYQIHHLHRLMIKQIIYGDKPESHMNNVGGEGASS